MQQQVETRLKELKIIIDNDPNKEHISHVIFVLLSAMKTHLLTKPNARRLNPLRAGWPMELAFISGFCSVMMRVFDSPWMGH